VEFAFIILSIFSEYLLPQSDKYSEQREKMVNEQIIARGITDKATLAAMRKVPRHLFEPNSVADQSYDYNPVLIGYVQTISNPYIFAYMT
jgi:protein-L-isoaspartate(D-aspartate) O-methyltransferase